MAKEYRIMKRKKRRKLKQARDRTLQRKRKQQLKQACHRERRARFYHRRQMIDTAKNRKKAVAVYRTLKREGTRERDAAKQTALLGRSVAPRFAAGINSTASTAGVAC
jgi:hypothetical protein